MEGKGRDERRGKEGNWKNGRGGKGISERNGCTYCYPVSQRVDQYLERLTIQYLQYCNYNYNI